MENAAKLIGQKYNHLTITGIDYDKSMKRCKCGVCKTYCYASCDCGSGIKTYDLSAVKTGHTKSCGCAKFNNPLIMEDLTGQVFGRLTVVRRDVERDKNRVSKGGNAHWLCQCSCGNKQLSSVGGYRLKTGETKSCGCLQSEITAERNRVYSPKQNKTYLYKNNIVEDTEDYIKVWDADEKNSFIVDKDDYQFISQWYWRKSLPRRKGETEGYWVTNAKKKDIEAGYPKTMKLHQMIAERKYGQYDKTKLMPDHSNRQHDDNTRKNIVLKPNIENTHNRNLSSANTSGKTGVCYVKSKNKWSAYIMVNYHNIHLGSYNDYADAVAARLAAEEQYGFTCDDVIPKYDL